MDNLQKVSYINLTKGHTYLIKHNDYAIKNVCKIGKYVNFKYIGMPVTKYSAVFIIFDDLTDYNLTPDSNKKNIMGTGKTNEFSHLLYTFYEILK